MRHDRRAIPFASGRGGGLRGRLRATHSDVFRRQLTGSDDDGCYPCDRKFYYRRETRGRGDGRTYETVNPATGEVLAGVAEAGAEDVQRAIGAARQAFDEGPWPRWPAGPPRQGDAKIAALIAERVNDLATLDRGLRQDHPRRDRRGQGHRDRFEYYAGAATKL